MKSMNISFSAHRYAPELFRYARVYDKPVDLDHDTRQKLGYIFCTKGRDACIAEIKRIYRAARKTRRLCTIGFMLKGSGRKYCFTRDLTAYDDSLPGKLRLFKKFKSFLLESDGKYLSGETASLSAGYQVENVTQHFDVADLSRPVKIYFQQRQGG